jgi:hypothetical protein
VGPFLRKKHPRARKVVVGNAQNLFKKRFRSKVMAGEKPQPSYPETAHALGTQVTADQMGMGSCRPEEDSEPSLAEHLVTPQKNSKNPGTD